MNEELLKLRIPEALVIGVIGFAVFGLFPYGIVFWGMLPAFLSCYGLVGGVFAVWEIYIRALLKKVEQTNCVESTGDKK